MQPIFDFTDIAAQDAATVAIDDLVAAIPGAAAHRDKIAEAVYAAVKAAMIETLARIGAVRLPFED